MVMTKYIYIYIFYICNSTLHYLSIHYNDYLLVEGNRKASFSISREVWLDPRSCRFFHLIKGPFSHEKRSHASLFLSAVSCHAALCRVAPGLRHADVVPPPIYHPLGALSFPPILAAPFAERWKCIDRRMARAGKRTGFPSQPPFPSHLPSLTLPLSLSVLPHRRLLPHLVLYASLPSSSSSVYLPLL